MISYKFKKSHIFQVGISLLLFLTFSTNASQYNFPTVFRLGAGVNASNPGESYPYCFDFKSRFVPGSAGTSLFKTSLIKTRKEFLKALNVSASAAGKYAFFSGSATASVDEKYAFTSDSLTWMVYLQSDLGRSEIYDEALKSEPQNLINQKKFSEFLTRCGAELVTQEQRSVLVAAVFYVQNLSAQQRALLEAKFSGSASTGAWSADASSQFRSFVEEASRNSRVTLDVLTIGGAGASDLAPLFTDYGDLTTVSAILRNYVAKMTFDTATATSYVTTNMSRYGWKGNTIDVGIQDSAIADYYLLYRDVDSIKQRAYGYVSGDLLGSIKLTDSQRNHVKTLYANSDVLVNSIIDTARKCRENASDCRSVSSFDLPIAKWPKIDPVGDISQIRNSVECVEVAPTISVEAKYLCEQKISFRVIANWPKIAGVEIGDRYGQLFSPIHGGTTDLAIVLAKHKAQFGEISESKFLELVTGEDFGSVKEAVDNGWSARELSIMIAFGSQSSTNRGLRSTLNFNFTDTKGLSVVRQFFMY